MTQETQEPQETQETQKPQEHERLELKLSATVTALVGAVEDVSKVRPTLGVVHIEKGKATVADGFVLVQVEGEEIPLEGVLDIPFSVLKSHCGKGVTVTTLENGENGTVSVAREIAGVTHKTEVPLQATRYPEVAHLVTNALSNTYSACIALDASRIKRLLKLFGAIGTGQTVRLYIPINPMSPILLTTDGIKAMLMPIYVDWSNDGIKKKAAKGIKYEEERHNRSSEG